MINHAKLIETLLESVAFVLLVAEHIPPKFEIRSRVDVYTAERTEHACEILSLRI